MDLITAQEVNQLASQGKAVITAAINEAVQAACRQGTYWCAMPEAFKNLGVQEKVAILNDLKTAGYRVERDEWMKQYNIFWYN